MSYARFTSNQLLLLAANRKFLLSWACSGLTPSSQSSPKKPCRTAGKSKPVATRRRMYGCSEIWETWGWCCCPYGWGGGPRG
jgi:hypothetical protein